MSTEPGSSARERMARLEQTPWERTVGGSTDVQSWRNSVHFLVSRRELLDLLIRRDLKAKYKDSVLGFFWSLARPLMLLLIYFVVLGRFLQADRGIPNFGVYIFTGIVIIGLFTEIVVGATGSVLANAGLVKKVALPREVFPLASVGSAFFNFAIQLAILLIATAVTASFPLHWDIFYAVPALLIVGVYGTALGLLFSAMNVYLRDVQYLVEVGVMLLFWASPVVYSWAMARAQISSSFLIEVYTNNPLTLAVLGFQRAFWLPSESLEQPSFLLLRMAVACTIGVALLLVFHRAFLKMQGNFAQEL